MSRVIALAAALMLVAGCGGEHKKTAAKPERAAETDWRPSAQRACARLTDPLVADMGAVDPPLAAVSRAGRAMKVRRLDRAITRLEKKLRAVAGSAR